MMEQPKRITLAINREPGTQGRWPIPVAKWPGFRIAEISDLSGNRITGFTQEGDAVVYGGPQNVDQLLATVELEEPRGDIEAAKLDFERQKAASEDVWRGRTYFFSIGSAILTALVALAVAWIAKPSHTGLAIHVDEVHACRDSLQRLGTLAQLQNQTLAGLSTAISGHVSTCDSVLEGIILATAREDTK
jgi:hypothetical protein